MYANFPLEIWSISDENREFRGALDGRTTELHQHTRSQEIPAAGLSWPGFPSIPEITTYLHLRAHLRRDDDMLWRTRCQSWPR